MDKRFHKSDTDKKLSGVCAGIAETLNIDITVVRIVTFFLCMFYPPTIIVYLFLAVTLPRFSYKTSEDEISAQTQSEDFSYDSQTPPNSKGNVLPSVSGAFGVSLICVALGSLIYRYLFKINVSLNELISFIVLAFGIYIFFSGVMEPKQNSHQRHTKITIGVFITFMSLSRMNNYLGDVFLPFDYLLASVSFLWPLLLIGLGISLVVSNKKIADFILAAIIVLVFLYAILSGILGLPAALI